MQRNHPLSPGRSLQGLLKTGAGQSRTAKKVYTLSLDLLRRRQSIQTTHSAEALGRRIETYINKAEEGMLILKINVNEFYSACVQKQLNRTAVRQYSYDPEGGRLRLKAMGSTAVHDAILTTVSNELRKMDRKQWLDERESHLIIEVLRSTLLPSAKYRHPTHLKKPAAIRKTPEAMICIREVRYPTVVFEVGFSESYDDLVADARQWLEKTKGRTQVVVLIKITEDKNALRIRQKAIAQADMEDEIEDSDSSDSPIASTNPSETPSFAIDHEALEQSLDHTEHVGPLTAFMEVWRFNANSKLAECADYIEVLPAPARKKNLTLSISDLIPPNPTLYEYTPSNPSKKWEFDMDDYRNQLAEGARYLAFSRAANTKKRKREIYSEYEDEGAPTTTDARGAKRRG